MTLFLHILGSVALLYALVFVAVVACAVWAGWRERRRVAREVKAAAVYRQWRAKCDRIWQDRKQLIRQAERQKGQGVCRLN